MKIRSLIICISFYILGIRNSGAQTTSAFRKFELEAGGYSSTSANLPFWLRANQYGEIPVESNAFTLRGQLEKDYANTDFGKKSKNWSYGYKVRAVANLGKNSQFVLPEAYFKIRFKALELYAGRKKEIFGLADTTLSSGSFIWSGNALPVPKIQLSIPEYTPILRNKLISIKGNFAHGWFGSADSTKNYFLHQKSLYLRIGKPSWHVNVHAGVNHQVQWGGRPTVPFIQGGTNTYIDKYGSSPEAYFYVVTGMPLAHDGKFYSGDQSGEGGNRLGNHLGTIDFAVEYNDSRVNVFLYKQSIYEDGSLSVLTNISDGLYGASLALKEKTSGILKFNFEFLDTRNQGGGLSSLGVTIPQLRGRDNYFNNGTYEDGWVYKRNTIGTPFLMPMANSPFLVKQFGPEKINPYYILNNRVKAYILSAYSKVKNVSLKTRISLNENSGSYFYTSINVTQVSLMQQISFPLKKYIIDANLGYDNSGLFDNNIGVVLLVKRYF